MAIKRLSNGLSPRGFAPDKRRAEEERWALSVCDDPSRAFVLLCLTTDLIFLKPEEQKECVGLIVVAPALLSGAEPQRLLARFQAAMRKAEILATRQGESACHMWQEGGEAADGQALGLLSVCPAHAMGRDFFRPNVDPRKAKRLERRPAVSEPPKTPKPRFLRRDGDREWAISVDAIREGLRACGFQVIEAPWITRDYAGSLNQRGFRERARAFLADQLMGSELSRDLPAAAPERARSL